MPFRKGPEINPFAGASQEPMQLLESISAMELASCVPIVKIVKIDPRTGRPDTESRPLMFDLIASPQFGSTADGFGVDSDSFKERALVSMQSLRVEYKLSYGLTTFREITLNFTVHHPELVFDRFSKIPWRDILEEGMSFSMEYGWSADPSIVKNNLFNGIGHVSPSGYVIKSTQTVLLVVNRYTLRVKQTGEVEVTVHALENGDIALRETRFSDAFENASKQGLFGMRALVDSSLDGHGSDDRNVARVKSLIDDLVPQTSMGRGNMYRMGDILDEVIAPMIEAAGRSFGYSGSPGPVELLLGNFNSRTGRQSDQYGGRHLGGLTSIAEFLIPANKLRDDLSGHFAKGRSMLLKNFIDIIINAMNSAEAWSPFTLSQAKPQLMMKTDTVKNSDGSLKLVLTIYDRKTVTDVFKDSEHLPLDQQSRDKVMKALSDRDVPVLEFARAGSLIIDASFEMQPDPLLQNIQINTAYRDRKDRVEQTQMPDSESRRGQSGPRDIVPISILQGSVTMHGNFVLDSFALLWVEFFSSSAISGVFHVLEKTDTIEPGTFTSTFNLISEGIDPLNTRRRRSDAEFAEEIERGKKTRREK